MSMTIRNLDADDDWTFGSGRQNYLRDDRAIALNVKTRIKSFLNDTFWQMDFGIDWWNLLGSKNPSASSNIEIQCRAMIGTSYGIVRINSVRAETDVRRNQSIRFNVDSIFTRNLIAAVRPL